MTSVAPTLYYPNQPGPGEWAMPPSRIDDLLRWAFQQGISDIKITPTDPVAVRQQGVWKHITHRIPSSVEIFSLVENMTRDAGATAQLLRGARVDFSYETFIVQGERRSGSIRFRGNATSTSDGNQGIGAAITLRLIPGKLPTFEDIGTPDELVRLLFPETGLVLLSGVMGSGKTTLLAATMRHIRTQMDKAVMTLEKPIEFDYTNIDAARGTIEQIEIPRMMQSFSEGVISSTRKAVDALLVGEANDTETMEAAIQAAEIGIAVYATLHTSSVSAIIPRVIHQFPEGEQNGIAVSMISALRVGVQQRLVPRVGGGRVALREWLEFTEDHRNWLIQQDLHTIQGAIESLVQKDGHPLLYDTEMAFKNGLIDPSVYTRILREKETKPA